MSVDLNLTGEGIAAILAISVTGVTSLYAIYRQIKADHKADERDARNEAQKVADDAAMKAQNDALALVAANQKTTHETLAVVADTVAGVQVNVAKVELATNSMKDQLRDTTALANLLQGRNEGIASEKQRAGAAPNSPTPDGAPSIAEVEAAKAAQVKAVEKDAAMRVEEQKTMPAPAPAKP